MKALAALYACTGALLATIGIGLTLRTVEPLPLLLTGAGLLLLSAGLVLWVRR